MDLTAVSSLPDLKDLDIYVTSFDEETKIAIESLESLERLDIKVEPYGCLEGMNFERLGNLHELTVMGAKDIDLASLSRLTELRSLMLEFDLNQEKPVDMKLLSGLESLEKIEILNAVLFNADSLNDIDTLREIRLTRVNLPEEEAEILKNSGTDRLVIIEGSLENLNSVN